MTKLNTRAITTALTGVCATLALTLAATPAAQAAARTGVSDSAQTALAPNVDYPSCAGHTLYTKFDPSGLAELYGWYNDNGSSTCIGEADEVESFDTGTGLLERVRVWSVYGQMLYQGYVGGSGAGTNQLTFIQHVNKLFPYSQVQVCASIVYNKSGYPVDPYVPGLCITV